MTILKMQINTAIKTAVLLLIWCVAACARKTSGDEGGVQKNPPSGQRNNPKTVQPIEKRLLDNDLSETEIAERLRVCKPTETTAALLALKTDPKIDSAATGKTSSFEDIKEQLKTACSSCHGAPEANTGGFSYLSEWEDRTFFANGKEQLFQGIKSASNKMITALKSGSMPPNRKKDASDGRFLELTEMMQDWIDAGTPNGSFPRSNKDQDGKTIGAKLGQKYNLNTTDLGDCVPLPSKAGHDPQRDAFFDQLLTLPLNISDTDLYTLDALELGQKGTFAYNVEYPLWADNAEKGRWIHLPSLKNQDGKWERLGAQLSDNSKNYILPDNTRTYKNFYKSFLKADGTKVFRKVETRIIVVRNAPRTPLFGTYVWNDSETDATLVTTPYRDSTPWKDTVLELTVEDKSDRTRTYAVPGRERCVECHKGSDQFILGFDPLQIHRRALGEGGRESLTTNDELQQVDRLLSYGVLQGPKRAEMTPLLEKIGPQEPRNVHELRAQGYFLGNCVHCHNPNGFAMKDNEVKLEFTAGKLFNFNTSQKSIHFDNSQKKFFVSSTGNLDASYIYERVSKPRSEQGLFTSMPMHTPGTDCRLIKLLGKWIRSFESIEAANAFETKCKDSENIEWLDTDFTWPKSDKYLPRRQDWRDPVEGMTPYFRDLVMSDGLQKTVTKPVPVGFWQAKPECNFPTNSAPEKYLPWMLTSDGTPKQPLNQLYYTSPGAWYFRTSCASCHGTKADGNTPLARGLLNWSGGSVRVANFVEGLFGKNGENLREFDVPDGAGGTKNIAGQYLIWMAMEGTKVNLPPEASAFLKGHKAQMLRQLRDKCGRHLIGAQQEASNRHEDFGVFRDVCYFENGAVEDTELHFNDDGLPLNPAKQNAWLDKASINAGWAIYEYLKNDLSKGKPAPSKSECEVSFSNGFVSK